MLRSLWEAWPRLGFGLKRTEEGGLHDRCPPGKRWVHCREKVLRGRHGQVECASESIQSPVSVALVCLV